MPISLTDRISGTLAAGGSVALAAWLLGPMATEPGAYLVGSHIHPDNLANQWLLPWAVDAVRTGAPLLHTTDYYWPVGDAPLLSGDGTQALLYAPFHLWFGWPAATPLFVGLLLILNGIAGWWAARCVTKDAGASLVAVPVCLGSPFVLMELSAGRFAQAAVWPLLIFLGLWVRYLDEPGPKRSIIAAIALVYTSVSYWYYGWFGVLAGAGLWLFHRLEHPAEVRRRHWLWHGVFSAVFLVLLAPLALIFIRHWGQVPGSAELLVFPPVSASHDRLPMWPVWRSGDPNTTAALQSVVVWVLALGGALWSWRARRVRAWVFVGLAFMVLGWGPAFPGAPYTGLYGLAAPLRRFWWPIRHVVVLQAALAVVASVGVAQLARRWGGPSAMWGSVAASAVAMSLALQGAPVAVERTPLSFPTEAYRQMADLPEGAAVVFPIAPEVTGTNDAMLYQLAHGHPIVTGHAPWVQRARPPEWDAWVQSVGFLARVTELERSGAADASLGVTVADITSLREAGVRWLVLDRTLVPLSLRGLVRSHDHMLDAVFGRPVIRTKNVQIWDVESFVDDVEVDVMDWSWPDGLHPAGPEWPLAAKRPESPMLGTPSGAEDKRLASP